ncbi:MAG: alanyl-tRNA editing protein [Oscillospiraceae bacterium]
MSEKLYYIDPYMSHFTATVLSCTQDNKGFATVLDRTAFYPEGGGQPCDIGFLTVAEDSIEVFDVGEKDGEIVHHTSMPLPVGEMVSGDIDFQRRFDHMQQHTGEHIFSGVVHTLFGYDNVGFHLGEKDVVVDFNGAMTAEDVRAVQDRANEIVWLDQKVSATFPDNVKELTYRSKKELSGKIRIVTAGDADVCACCGTHTSSTAQCGPIVAVNFAAYKGGVRINILSGRRAVDFLMERNHDCYAISHALSSPLDKITLALQSRMEETDSLKLELSEAKKQLMEYWAAQAEAKNNLCVFEKAGLNGTELQNLCLMLSKKAGTAIVFTSPEKGSSKLCIISTVFDTNRLGKHITANLGGKGGGKPGIFQGFIETPTDCEALRGIVSSYSE